jgi:FAD/FMN-containing dehydrogenase/Fe-S oxidoreductase
MKNNQSNWITSSLRPKLEGDIYGDYIYKTLYATDASIYRVKPKNVVFPKSIEDVQTVLDFSINNNVPITPRGAGTSLAGQAIGSGIILDFSRFLNDIHWIDPKSRTAKLSPGVILDLLNGKTKVHNLKFGPDPASGDRATFGGMIGNNSSGSHSIQFGMTSDHVQEIEVLLADGSFIKTENKHIASKDILLQRNGIEGGLYEFGFKIHENETLLQTGEWPQVWRKASGYNLDYLINRNGIKPPLWDSNNSDFSYPPSKLGHINLTPLFVGSEGTLGIVTSATVNLVDLPKNTILCTLEFDNIEEACDAVPNLLNLSPSAIELIPPELIQLATKIPAYAKLTEFVQEKSKTILLLEFEGDNQSELINKVNSIENVSHVAQTNIEQSNIWKIRKVGLGLLMSVEGNKKPIPFVEDVAVPVEKLGHFVREFEKILSNFGTKANYYAHASAGCLHIRPLIDLKIVTGLEQLRGITKSVVVLTKSIGGAISGEHGDGRARSEWTKEMFGDDIYSLFVELKNLADPNNIFNPQMKIAPQRIEENLRFGLEYRIETWSSKLDFRKGGGLDAAIELCNGAGVCRNSTGVMCPTFQATNNEYLSTRGRANTLREVLSDPSVESRKASKIIFNALDTCIECKGCKSECPTGVDIAKIKYDFLSNYYKLNTRPIRDYLFSSFHTIGEIASKIPKVYNWLIKNKVFRYSQDVLFGISKNRKLPKIQLETSNDLISTKSEYVEEIILLKDSYNNYFNNKILSETIKLLDEIGCKVHVLKVLGGGRVLISKGFLEKAKQHFSNLLAEIGSIDQHGSMPIIGLEPSEIYALKDELLDLFPKIESAKNISERAWMLEEFLLRNAPEESFPRYTKIPNRKQIIQKDIIFHGHCYQKAQPPANDNLPIGEDASIALLQNLGHKVKKIEAGCCGMAGSFGYHKEHYELSMNIGRTKLFPAINSKKDHQIIVTTGASCKSQILDGTKEKSFHPVELISNYEN